MKISKDQLILHIIKLFSFLDLIVSKVPYIFEKLLNKLLTFGIFATSLILVLFSLILLRSSVNNIELGFTTSDLILFMTFLIVYLYTYETYILRKETTIQNKLLIKPVVSIILNNGDSSIDFVNYGRESSYNLKIEKIFEYDGYYSDLLRKPGKKKLMKTYPFSIPILQPNKPQKILLTKKVDHDGVEAMTTLVKRHSEFFVTGKKFDIHVSYQDAMRNTYTCVITVVGGSVAMYKEM